MATKKGKGIEMKQEDGGKNMKWNIEMNHSFADFVRNQNKSGRKADGGWKTMAYNVVAANMSAKFNMIVTKENVLNHLKGWKKTYVVVVDILSQSGFNWDSGSKMIIVDDKNVWNEYEKVHQSTVKSPFPIGMISWTCAQMIGLLEQGLENVDDAIEEMRVGEENNSIDGSEGLQDESSKRKVISSTFTSFMKPKKLKVEDNMALAVSEMAFSIKEMTSVFTSKTAALTVYEV